MTESEWESCEDPFPMLEFQRGRCSQRKLRLFGVACCRNVPLAFNDDLIALVNLAEQFADGTTEAGRLLLVPAPDLFQFDLSHNAVCGTASLSGDLLTNVRDGSIAAARLLGTAAAAKSNSRRHEIIDALFLNAKNAEQREQSDLLRDIFGNPFRPVTLDPRWLSSAVLELARTIYDERDWERMPTLADALMDASCDSEEIIEHCQGPVPHVRGCFVVDLLLRKS